MAYNPYTGEDDTQPINLANNLNTQTAFRPNTFLDNRIKMMQGMEDQGYAQPNLQKLKQRDWDQFQKKEIPLSLPRDQYKGVEGYTASVPEGMRETVSDATYFDEVNAPNYMGARSPLKQVVGEEYGETITPYLGAETPIPPRGETHYLEQGDFAGTYDPAFGQLEDFIGGTTRYPDPYQSGRVKQFHALDQIPRLSQDNFYENFRDQGIAGLDVQETLAPEETRIRPMDELINPEFDIDWLEKTYPKDLPYNELDDSEALDIERQRIEERSRPVIESEEEQYLDQGITSPNKWQKFLSKITRQPYRPAMGGVTMRGGKTYSPAQLNKMNALGGWYSEPSRAARRTEKRIENMLARRAQGKSYSATNLKDLSGGQYDYGEGRQGSYTAPTPAVPAGVTTSSGMHGGKHYMIGGRVGYNTGGRVGILSVF